MAPPNTLDELYQRTKDFAVLHSGASLCHVKSVVPVVTGHEDGIYWPAIQIVGLNPLTIVPWLERLLEGKIATPLEAHAALNALVSMYHEHIHALGPAQLGVAYGRTIYLKGPQGKGAVDFENGITELWARTTLTALVHAVGVDELLNNPPEYESGTYVLEMLAVASVIDKIAEITSSNMLEILRLMASHVPDTRAEALSEFVVDHRGVPDEKRADVATAFRNAFREVQLVEDITSEDYPGWARTTLWAAVVRAEA
jgi:hypothetical protein